MPRIRTAQLDPEGAADGMVVALDAASGEFVTRVQDGGAAKGQTWVFDVATGDADPGAGKYRLNNATQASATQVFVNDGATNGVDMTNVLSAMESGDRLYIQELKDPARFQLFNVTGAPVDGTGYWKIPVASASGGAAIRDTEPSGFAFFWTAGGGGGGPHASTHISGGSDEIDGDRLDINHVPSNYTRDTSAPEVTLVDELTAHLKGIDNALASSDNDIVKARRTTTLAFPAAWTDVTFDTTDEESDAAVLDHQLGTADDRILVGTTGRYLVMFALASNQVGSDAMEARLRINDTTVITGTPDEWGPTHTGAGGNHTVRLGRVLPVSLTAGDFISLQIQNTDTGGTVIAGAILAVISLRQAGGGGGGGGGAGFPSPLWPAGSLDVPNNADWAINAKAGLRPDTDNAAIDVCTFDDAVEQGRGFEFPMPATAASMKIHWSARAETAPGGAVVARWNLRFRRTSGGVAVGAWSAAIQLADSDFGTNEFFEDDEDDRTLASWGLTAGELYQFEFTRDATDGADTLVGDAALSTLGLGFS